MRLNTEQEMLFGKAKITIKGLLTGGGGIPYNRCGSGTLSIPKHQVPGVYAGSATHGLNGKRLSKDIPVIVSCNDLEKSVHVRANSMLGSSMGSMSYDSVNQSNCLN